MCLDALSMRVEVEFAMLCWDTLRDISKRCYWKNGVCAYIYFDTVNYTIDYMENDVKLNSWF